MVGGHAGQIRAVVHRHHHPTDGVVFGERLGFAGFGHLHHPAEKQQPRGENNPSVNINCGRDQRILNFSYLENLVFIKIN